MMVRKPVAAKKEETPLLPPYPISRISPRDGLAEGTAASGEMRLGASATGLDQEDRGFGGLPIASEGQKTSSGTRNGLPPALRVGKGGSIPPMLQAGSADVTPRSSWESERSISSAANAVPSYEVMDNVDGMHDVPGAPQLTNPYRRKQVGTGKAPERPSFGEESSADIWGDGKIKPLSSIGKQNYYQPQTLVTIDQPQSASPSTRHPFTEPWMRFDSSPVDDIPPVADAGLGSTETKPAPGGAAAPMPSSDESYVTHIEEIKPEFPSLDAAKIPARLPENYGDQPQPINDNQHDLSDYTNAVDHDFVQPMQNIGQTQIIASYDGEYGPALPPRISQEEKEVPPPQPPRPPPKTSNIESGTSQVATPEPKLDESPRPRKAIETYQIRHVNWCDASSLTSTRRSPIMVQNVNGPCPLLALVNALVLSTPADITTALVETLRLREQVSLGLLLDAVIDELMSGRRGDAAQNLPDVSDLYAFLVNLHTGMNVNPSFVPLEEKPINLMDAPVDLPETVHGYRKPGGFEETREMKLYSTFAIPLIHGWIPPRNHPAFAALKRTARTYEDAQNLMFREEELEEKLTRQGLSPEEQINLEDIASVKYFLSSTATQLTGYGLDTVTETLPPGSIAILFRNDHFSTLYRHPRSGQLLTLVTDMGYAGHDEVVWESLVDVSGEGSELFSGDFRPVGNVLGDTGQEPENDLSENDSGWETVGPRSRRTPRSGRTTSRSDLPAISTLNLDDNTNPKSPTTEQEDHDLALAMQLQEEEEERDRQEAAARRREDELSQAYLNSSDSQGRRTFPGFGRGAATGPSPPPRGDGSARQAPIRPTPRESESSEDAPPPSYEQAAKGPAYHPPTDHPAHPHASPSPNARAPRPPTQPTRPRQSSAYSEHAAAYGGSPSSYGPPRRGGHLPRNSASGSIGRGGRGVGGLEGAPGVVRRRSGAPGSAVSPEDDRRDKECILM